MFFISLPFLLFFSVFFLLYWFVFDKNVKGQNLLLLTGSYFFYAWGEPRFLLLLLGSSLLTYFLGIGMHRAGKERYKNALLWVGILLGLGSLCYFKYLNHFLPLGLSFYTFKTLSYLLDIRKGKIRPTTDWIVFFSYISFFPCLVSGPIDRPGALIPQLETRRTFEYAPASDGMRQILWGLFKKVVIADNCAVFSGDIFDHYKTLPASALLYGAFLVTIQVYADFSGYSDMAIGLGRLIGFNITRNFNYPFFARNIADFWRRWHITLTSWLTDYVFSPLTIYFRNYGKAGLILAILITFTAIGVWHGPNWTFVVFGFLHGCYYIPLILRGTINKKRKGIHMAGMAGTFFLVMLTFVIFRSASLGQAFDYYRRLVSGSILSPFQIVEKVNTIAMLACIVLMFVAEWLQRDKQHAMEIDFIPRFSVRALFYFSLILIILTFGPTKNADFIYFKF
jgi:alginate O-acetyltransferase complex protein AlgI